MDRESLEAETSAQKRKKIDARFILSHLALFCLSLLLARAEVNALSPFLFAFFFACLYAGFDEKLISVFTLTAAVLSEVSVSSFYTALTVVAVGLVVYYFHRFFRRRFRLFTLFFAYMVSLVCYIYYHHSEAGDLISYLVLGLVSLYVFVRVLQVCRVRKNCFRLTLDESICFLFLTALLGMGMSQIYLAGCALWRLVLMLVVLILLAVGSPQLTFSVSLAFSLGVAISTQTLFPVAEFALLTLLGSVFAYPQKGKMVFMVMLSDVFIQYFFFSRTWDMFYQLAPVLVACLVFLILPNRQLNALTDFVYVKKSELSSRNLVNSTRKNIRSRMSELSNVFLDMKQIHLNMVKKQLSKEELVAMLTRECLSVCCRDCLEKSRCTRGLGTDNQSGLATLIETAVTKGKITLLDIPSGMTNRCGKLNNLISVINRMTDEYRQYKSMLDDVNNVKILLAEQMGAVSRLLLDVGQEIDSNVVFDLARENKIISRLLANNFECREVLLYNEKDADTSAILILKANPSLNYPLLEKVVSDCLKLSMQTASVLPVENGDYTSVTLRKKSKYDCVFGLSSCNKSGNAECGDSHSIIRLSHNRFLLALCDGMGSGQSAHRMSAITLGLIEDFYKVGFDNDIVLESVNKLLAINNQEDYSTLDICLVDLDRQIADFIKVGAPYGLIKRETAVECVEGGALPIGALDSISPSVHKTTLSTKDIVIMATDGVMDAFADREDMIEYVSKISTNNPQTIAESLLNEALRLNDMTAKDDMTVLVARTYLKNL